MYGVGFGGIFNAIRLIGEGASYAVLVAAVLAFILRRAWRNIPPIAWLLIAPAAVIFVQFIALAANKPPEYARFALFIDIALAIFACLAAKRAAILVVLITAFFGAAYEIAFIGDCGGETSRIQAARVIQNLHGMELSVWKEPAPFSVPPVDLFRWKIVLPPKGQEDSATLKPIDRPSLTPISWADKRFAITSSLRNSTGP
jgi:hypothetical protein